MNAPDITVASSYATDRIFDGADKWICDREGGPCLFILDALRSQKISYDVLAPEEKAIVDIKIDENGEVGTVKFVPELEVDWSSISSKYVLISTLFDEISLAGIETYKGNVCLDVQGYVRKVRTGGKTMWSVPNAFYENCFCVKATELELKYLPSQFIEQQKQNILLVTRGEHGVEYWNRGKRKEISPKEVISSSHTLGAGDTFFANFIAELSRGQTVDTAIEKSMDMTSDFLKKNSSL